MKVEFPRNNYFTKSKQKQLEALLPPKEEPIIEDDCDEVHTVLMSPQYHLPLPIVCLQAHLQDIDPDTERMKRRYSVRLYQFSLYLVSFVSFIVQDEQEYGGGGPRQMSCQTQ